MCPPPCRRPGTTRSCWNPQPRCRPEHPHRRPRIPAQRSWRQWAQLLVIWFRSGRYVMVWDISWTNHYTMSGHHTRRSVGLWPWNSMRSWCHPTVTHHFKGTFQLAIVFAGGRFECANYLPSKCTEIERNREMFICIGIPIVMEFSETPCDFDRFSSL